MWGICTVTVIEVMGSRRRIGLEWFVRFEIAVRSRPGTLGEINPLTIGPYHCHLVPNPRCRVLHAYGDTASEIPSCFPAHSGMEI